MNEDIKDGNIILTASPFSNRQDVLNSTVDVPATAYRMCNSSTQNIPSTQFSSIGNSIIKPGIPKLSAHAVSDDVNIRPVILHPTKSLSSHVHMKNETLIKTIGFTPSRSSASQQSRIVTTSIQRSIMESHTVSPLIITPTPHVIHTTHDIVPAKIVPIPSSPAVSHFSVINKPVPYESITSIEYTGMRQSMVSGSPPVYTQSDFARFPPKTYHHKSAILNPAVIHGPITGNIEESCINIPNSQHVFKPIISPRPSILRKRDADGVLRAQKNLIPILTKPDPDDSQHANDLSQNRNGYCETGLQIDSIMVPQNPESLPHISSMSKKSHIMVEISPRKKPRKQLLPVNQDSPFKIIGDDMEYVEEKIIKTDIFEEFHEEDINNCNDDLPDGDAEDEAEDDLDDNEMDVDDDCPADDENYDENDDDDVFGNEFGDDFDFIKTEKTYYEEIKTTTVIEETSSFFKLKNKRPTLLGGIKSTWHSRAQIHHYQKITDFKVKETKKQTVDVQQSKLMLEEGKPGWRIDHLIKQLERLVEVEERVTNDLRDVQARFERVITDSDILFTLTELIKDNIQRSKVARGQLDEIVDQVRQVFEYQAIIEDVVDKHGPKDLKKKCAKVLSKT